MATTSPILRERLQPYLPRLTLEWLASDPDALHRSVDGSMVFVDISGFTALSEKLAKLGRVGAEEMADAINNCFSELLVEAYAQDGGLLKFGGDALLLLFAGGEAHEHAARAARAAVGMRKRLREVGLIETPGGRVKLRMSVGVHSGRFDFFLVGGSHRELLVTGPAATEVVTMEGTADAGEIVVSPALAAALPSSMVGAVKGPGRLLRSAPPNGAESTLSVVPDVPDELLRRSVAVATRESLLAGVLEPEHRQVAVAFIHFEGLDGLIEHAGPEVAATELDRLVRDTQEAVDELEVCFLSTDVDADGGKLILTAGAPRAVGDDEERILLALRRIADIERRIPIRIGVNHGPVFAGDIGPHYRRTYTVMGDTVNLAARLMAKAPPGQIYASESVLERSATRFETVELEPFMVKGKARPVQAWSVGIPLGRPKHTAAEEYPLHGRRDEMRTLRAAMNAARGNTRRTIVIEGEAGLGKTRLLDEVLRGCEDFRSTGATGETFTATTPYVAFRDVLRELIGVAWEDTSDVVVARLRELAEANDPDLIPWLPLVATAADADMPSTPEVDALGAEFRRPKLHESVIDFLRATVTERTVFAFEDAQLMDEASADLLKAIVTDERVDRPWLILALRRPEGDGFAPPAGDTIDHLDLEPLGVEAVREFALTVTDDAPLPGHVLEQTIERSNGNPQLLLDLVHAARTGDGQLPESVEAAATVRIDALTPHDRQLVRRVSVFGLAFHPRFLPDVLDDASPVPDDATWERLAEFFELEGGGYLRFRRAVIRDAAYSGLPFRTRQRLHLAVGTHFERELPPNPEENAGLLSLHFSLGGDHDRTWRYARIAADRAKQIFANVEAARLYDRAIDSGRRSAVGDEALLSAYEALGDAHWAARAYPDARRAYAEAIALCQGPVHRAHLMMRRSLIEQAMGKLPQSLRWLTKARGLITDIDDAEAILVSAEIDARRALVFQNQGRSTEAIAVASRAIDEATAVEAHEVLGEAENALADALIRTGRPGGVEHWQKALKHFEDAADLSGQQMILGNLGVGAYFEGRWDEALDFYRRAEAAAERLGDPANAAIQKMNIAEVLVEQGSLDEAGRLLTDAVRVHRADGEDFLVAACQVQLGRVKSMTGAHDEAHELFSQARERYLAIGAPAFTLEVDAREAESRLFAMDPEGAIALSDPVNQKLDNEGGVNVLTPLLDRVRGYALLQQGDVSGAEEAFRSAVARARERGADHDAALGLIAEARMARHRGTPAPDLEQEAWDLLRSLGIRALPAVPLR